ncbi:MAG: adenine deaminase C-terminal domain-containing protein, partial [Clostridia bacterium]|nr:adenine deaminase C-terminal domain-containing protein [Clostridia bacterium]
VAHDSHNIVVIGDSDLDMRTAAEHLQEIGGGIAIASEGKIIRSLSLPIGGLMSDIPLEKLQERLEDMLNVTYTMGVSRNYDPFMALAFLALPVIPELKVTDLGLFDVVNFRFTNIDEV